MTALSILAKLFGHVDVVVACAPSTELALGALLLCILRNCVGNTALPTFPEFKLFSLSLSLDGFEILTAFNRFWE